MVVFIIIIEIHVYYILIVSFFCGISLDENVYRVECDLEEVRCCDGTTMAEDIT